MNRTALVMAGGTGGHIFPGLAVAEALRDRGWAVHWLGAPGGMEQQLVPPRGFAFEPVQFGGLRGKGPLTLLMLPARLLRAFVQSIGVLRRVRPDVVIGLGGYITFPGGLMSVLLGKPLALHEQNSVAGMTNKVLARVADQVLTAFPGAFPGKGGNAAVEQVGNPVRPEMTRVAAPADRLAGRTGPLRLLVVGGSLGAQALNDTVPQALARLPADARPTVVHQAGEKHLAALQASYDKAGVTGDCRAFITDMAAAYADADLVICRSGAMTVAEICSAGAAALFVPFPHAVDDHQTTNAKYLSHAQAGWLKPQSALTPDWLAAWLAERTRPELIETATRARAMARPQATARIADICEAAARKEKP